MAAAIPDPQQDLEEAIAAAKKKLENFETAAGTSELLARLRRVSPMHPFLAMRMASLIGSTLAVLAAVGTMAGSVYSRDLAVTINSLQDQLGFPLLLVFVVLAACGFVGMLAGHFGAVSAAQNAPYLPHEAKVHQRLMADVQQLEAQRAVKERMTPRPATPRLLDRRSVRSLT